VVATTWQRPDPLVTRSSASTGWHYIENVGHGFGRYALLRQRLDDLAEDIDNS
jgi:hypothetical protein